MDTQYPEQLQHGSYLDLARRLSQSFKNVLDRSLIEGIEDPTPQQLFDAPFVLIAHDTQPDPVFCFGNKEALNLFDYSWHEFVKTPSQETVQELQRMSRFALLTRASQAGVMENYEGVRINNSGRLFKFTNGVIWNIFEQDKVYGQAAIFSNWNWI